MPSLAHKDGFEGTWYETQSRIRLYEKNTLTDIPTPLEGSVLSAISSQSRLDVASTNSVLSLGGPEAVPGMSKSVGCSRFLHACAMYALMGRGRVLQQGTHCLESGL